MTKFSIEVRQNDEFALFIHKTTIGWKIELWRFWRDRGDPIIEVNCLSKKAVIREIELVIFPKVLIDLGISPLNTSEIKIHLLQ